MEKTKIDFPCDNCGLCCRNLSNISLYDDLNRGDGVCKFLDKKTNSCMIYQMRPIKCNIVDAYSYFADWMSYKEYIALNMEVCRKLKEKRCHCH